MISIIVHIFVPLFLLMGIKNTQEIHRFSYRINTLFEQSISIEEKGGRLKAPADPILLRAFDVPGVSEDFKNKIVSGIISTYTYAPYLDRAFAIFDSLIYMRPERPEGYFLKSSLFLSIYQVDKSPAVFDSLATYSNKTIEVTEALLKDNPEDQYLHFYLGAIYGNMGLQYLRQKSWWKAYRNGIKGKKYLEKASKIDPELSDAQLGIGIFQYYADILPKYLKPLLFIVRLGGNRVEGLEKIRYAAESSALSKIEAYYFLAKILHEYEGNTAEAQNIYQALHEQFPQNMYYHYSFAVFNYENGNYIEAKNILEEMSSRPHRYYNRSVKYYLGNVLHIIGDYDKSNTYFRTIAAMYPQSSKDKLCEIYYRIGLNYEYQNDRRNALQYYDLAKKTGSKLYSKEIKKLIRTPLNSDDIFVKSVNNLLFSNLYEEAEALVTERLDRQKIDDTIDEYYINIYNLQLAEIKSHQKNFTESQNFLQNFPEKRFKGNSEFLARYHILGVVTNMELRDKEEAERHIKKIKKIDLKKLPVKYRRTFNYLQQKLFGEVKYR